MRAEIAAAKSVQSVEDIVGQHPDEWLAIDVTAEAAGRPKAGRLVFHAKDADEVWRRTRSRKRLYIVYAGPALKEGYAAAF
jgi:hypothetical protein